MHSSMYASLSLSLSIQHTLSQKIRLLTKTDGDTKSKEGEEERGVVLCVCVCRGGERGNGGWTFSWIQPSLPSSPPLSGDFRKKRAEIKWTPLHPKKTPQNDAAIWENNCERGEAKFSNRERCLSSRILSNIFSSPKKKYMAKRNTSFFLLPVCGRPQQQAFFSLSLSLSSKHKEKRYLKGGFPFFLALLEIVYKSSRNKHSGKL